MEGTGPIPRSGCDTGVQSNHTILHQGGCDGKGGSGKERGRVEGKSVWTLNMVRQC